MAVVTTDAGGRVAMRHLSVSEAARRLGARPRDISDLFYKRRLSDHSCPIVGGRRLIPERLLGAIAIELRRAGKPVRPSESASPAEGGDA